MPRLFEAGRVFHDLSGNVAASGTLTVYQNETTTAVTIYTDEGLSVPASNPVTLGSDGRISGDIFVPAGVPYTVLLKDRLDVQVFSRDDVYGASAGALAPVATLSALQALAAPGEAVTIELLGRTAAGDGGGHTFRWDSSDLSTEVAADEVTASQGDGGLYVAPSSDRTGASGAWVHAGDTSTLLAPWYGMLPDNSTVFSRTLAEHVINTAGSGKTVVFPPGTYLGNSDNSASTFVDVDANVTVLAYGATFSRTHFGFGGDGPVAWHGGIVDGTDLDSALSIGGAMTFRAANLTVSDVHVKVRTDVHQCGFKSRDDFDNATQTNIRLTNLRSEYTAGASGSGCAFEIREVDDFVLDGFTGIVDSSLAGDDGIVIKSVNAASSNIRISNAHLSNHAAILGIGDQTAQDITGVHLSNCTGWGCANVVNIRSQESGVTGGRVSNVVVQGVSMDCPTTGPKFASSLVKLQVANGGILDGITVRDVAFTGVAQDASYMVDLTIAGDSGDTMDNVVIDGVNAYMDDASGSGSTYNFRGVVKTAGGGTINKLKLTNVNVDAAEAEPTQFIHLMRGDDNTVVNSFVVGEWDIHRSVLSGTTDLEFVSIENSTTSSFDLDVIGPMRVPSGASIAVDSEFDNSPLPRTYGVNNLYLGDIAAGTAVDVPALATLRRSLITHFSVTTSSAVTQSDTNYATITGRGSGPLSSITTQVTGGTAIAAYDAVSITDTPLPSSNAVTGTDGLFRFQVTHTGSGAALDDLLVTVHYIELA